MLIFKFSGHSGFLLCFRYKGQELARRQHFSELLPDSILRMIEKRGQVDDVLQRIVQVNKSEVLLALIEWIRRYLYCA